MGHYFFFHCFTCRLCNMDIISHVQQVICFAFHDSRLLMETCQEAKNLRKIVTLFYNLVVIQSSPPACIFFMLILILNFVLLSSVNLILDWICQIVDINFLTCLSWKRCCDCFVKWLCFISFFGRILFIFESVRRKWICIMLNTGSFYSLIFESWRSKIIEICYFFLSS